MIPLQRTTLLSEAHDRLQERAARLHATLGRVKPDTRVTEAREAWKSARTVRRDLMEHLTLMASGIRRCMYCGDSLGTDIDHFEPLAEAPPRAFDWPNHLLACSYCNSNAKRELFPRGEDGEPLLIDPSSEDPYDHLELMPSTGLYTELTARGKATIEIFRLNRPDLERGRRSAFVRIKSMLRDHAQLGQDGKDEEAHEIVASLRDQPFADVLYAMLRFRAFPGASTVLGDPNLPALLDNPVFHFWPEARSA
ncbi:HNH endonuclease [Actinomadura meridiana]|uniref:HNH endonuclease n=1 Tax=Actinomadura meridiana TaxID=559626 RepID=A0ABP8CBS7_9ACTN